MLSFRNGSIRPLVLSAQLCITAVGGFVLGYGMPGAAPLNAEEALWIDYPSARAASADADALPAHGRRVVLLAGDEEYRSEESLPMLARILNQKHGLTCRVLFAVDPESGTIDPNNRTTLPGYEALDTADIIVMALRFRSYPDPIMGRFDAAMERGTPIVALRTSTHAFQFPAESKFAHYNDFGRRVLGENWVSHWGNHKHEATRGVIDPMAVDHPVLRGVVDVFGDTDVYEAHPPNDARIVLRGEVVAGMKPTDPSADYVKKRSTDGANQPVNQPMMPVAWTREVASGAGQPQRVFCTTMGSSTDFACEDLRRLVVNAVYWGLGLDVPERADAELVGSYEPTPYAFDGYRRNVRPADLK